MKIGTITLSGKTILAPMAGVTDCAFRQICREQGAALSITEMVSARALTYHDKKSSQLLTLAANERPAAVQIFGHDPQVMAQGAQLALEQADAQIVDINMGCPAPKIVGNGDGCALMRDISLAGQIITAVKKAVTVPVTVKFRLGWDDKSRNALEFAHMAQQSGADAICVHGRTRAQQYAGHADWQAIGEIKAAVKIPVIANGDITTPQAAAEILQQTAADAIMIGRASMGDPWLFARINAYLAGEQMPPEPTLQEKLQTAVRQVRLAMQEKGEHIALLQARKQVNWYLKGVAGIKSYKTQVTQLSTMQQLETLAVEILQAMG